MSKIPKHLIEAYNSALFIIYCDDADIVIQPNTYSKDLIDLHAKYSVNSSAIITAYNPYSKLKDNDVNQIAQSKLINIVSKQWSYLLADGYDPKGKWLPEPSLLILGIELQDALMLGKRFKQNAIIYNSKDGNVALHESFNSP